MEVSANGALGFLCVAAHTSPWSIWSGNPSTPANVWNGNGVPGVLNVRDFGAYGDGNTAHATADTAAAMAAASACGAAGGGTVYFPPGKYSINENIYSQSEGTNFVGGGREATTSLVGGKYENTSTSLTHDPAQKLVIATEKVLGL
ncbi:MAG: hypothetical protein JO199_01175, partial [Candidatus Eremiobacteraeota bacterium]|nr:hypothetical protein [Candidatus Eremiobacteraeota bacterium]